MPGKAEARLRLGLKLGLRLGLKLGLRLGLKLGLRLGAGSKASLASRKKGAASVASGAAPRSSAPRSGAKHGASASLVGHGRTASSLATLARPGLRSSGR
jgi:hypothetical protein